MTHDQEALKTTRLTESDNEMAELSNIRLDACHRLTCANTYYVLAYRTTLAQLDSPGGVLLHFGY